MGGDYEWSVFGDSTAYFGGQFSFMGERFANFSDRGTGTDVQRPESSATLDLRAGLERDHWTLEFYGKNVTDEAGINDVNTDLVRPNGAFGIGVIRPRTFGMSLGFRF